MKKMAIIHTSAVSLQDLTTLCQEIMPEVEIINIIDDSLLAEVKRNNGITPAVISRMCRYVQSVESLDVDLIFNQCSSVGEAFAIASRCTAIPTLRVDEPMAEKAVSLGTRIGVIATVASTVKPSCDLIRTTAQRLGKAVVVQEYLAAEALDILMKEKDVDKHNQIVLAMIRRAENDVVVLAQGSMITLLPYLNEMPAPVLTSPRLGIERAWAMLQEKG